MMWDILNKIATIGTILGIPARLGGIVTLAHINNMVYDMYNEVTVSGTLCRQGSYTRSDRRRGQKREQQQRIPSKRERR